MIIALDQALNTTGFSTYDDNGKLINFGKHVTTGDTQIDKIIDLKNWLLNDLLRDKDLEKDTIVLEGIQLQNIPGTNRQGNVETFRVLAVVQGVLICALIEAGAKDVRIVYASEWKSTCGIKGANRAEQKRNAQAYVTTTFGIKATQDESDAICIGQHIVLEKDKVLTWE